MILAGSGIPIKRPTVSNSQIATSSELAIMLTSNCSDPLNSAAVCWDEGGTAASSKAKMLPRTTLNTPFEYAARMPLGRDPDRHNEAIPSIPLMHLHSPEKRFTASARVEPGADDTAKLALTPPDNML
jgi:hypothetical protein